MKSPLAVHKPARLKRGGRIGVLAPSGCVDKGTLDAGVKALVAQGFEVELGDHILAQNGYLAGAAEGRAKDLVDFFYRADIDAVFCARGGFGSMQMLPYLSSEIRKHPKIFAGYSDVTVLLNWLRQFFGMVTFHAPMVAMDFARGLSEFGSNHLWSLLGGQTTEWRFDLGEVVCPGNAQAEMMGGCLSLLVTTLGTPYEIDTRGKILFLEDVGEKPYRIERLLTHLKMAGKLDQVSGVLFGDFTHCEGEGTRGVKQVIEDMFRDAPYPVVTGMKAGHGQENLALPFGSQMKLNGNSATLELLESPVA